MRKTVLFIAMSLDGYIADQKGRVDWLGGHDTEEQSFDPYSIFIQDIDTVIMGWNTYNQIVTELSPSNWIYADLSSYVITHKNIPSKNGITFTGKNPCAVIREQKQLPGKGIWICGGADLIHQIMEEDLIDEYYISVIPAILGSGIRLFGTFPKKRKLNLVRTHSYNGIVELVYSRRSAELQEKCNRTDTIL